MGPYCGLTLDNGRRRQVTNHPQTMHHSIKLWATTKLHGFFLFSQRRTSVGRRVLLTGRQSTNAQRSTPKSTFLRLTLQASRSSLCWHWYLLATYLRRHNEIRWLRQKLISLGRILCYLPEEERHRQPRANPLTSIVWPEQKGVWEHPGIWRLTRSWLKYYTYIYM